MAYDEFLEERITTILDTKNYHYRKMKMMGGLSFMVDEKMCIGIVKNQLMARISPSIYEEVLKKPFCNEMNFTGRSMKGYVFIEAEGLDYSEDLEYWIQLCLDYNPFAKASKIKKPKKQ